jgi:hypothetical protein
MSLPGVQLPISSDAPFDSLPIHDFRTDQAECRHGMENAPSALPLEDRRTAR